MDTNTKPRLGRPKSPYKELYARGVTPDNWLKHLDEMTDEEITAMLDLYPHKKRLDEERKASPNITDRQWAETMLYFGL